MLYRQFLQFQRACMTRKPNNSCTARTRGAISNINSLGLQRQLATPWGGTIDGLVSWSDEGVQWQAEGRFGRKVLDGEIMGDHGPGVDPMVRCLFEIRWDERRERMCVYVCVCCIRCFTGGGSEIWTLASGRWLDGKEEWLWRPSGGKCLSDDFYGQGMYYVGKGNLVHQSVCSTADLEAIGNEMQN